MASPFSGSAGRKASQAVIEYYEQTQKDLDRRIGDSRGMSIRSLQSGYGDAGKMYNDAIRQYQPYEDTGLAAFGQYADATGVNGAAGYDRAEGNFRASPGYEWAVDQSTDAVARKASSLGALGSGNTMAAISDRAGHMADQEYDDYLGRLDGLGKMGYAASSAQAGLSQAKGNLRYGLGSDKSSTYLGYAGMDANAKMHTADQSAEALKGGMLAGQNAAANRWNFGMQGLNLLAGFAGKFA